MQIIICLNFFLKFALKKYPEFFGISNRITIFATAIEKHN